MARTVRCRDAAGALVLDLSSEGYELDFDGVRPGPRVWLREPTRSPWIDGTGKGKPPTLDESTVELTLRCLGSSAGQVEARYQALLAAVEAPDWLLEIVTDGVSETYRAEPADTTAGRLTVEMVNNFRTVVATVPVQPSPVVTGLEP